MGGHQSHEKAQSEGGGSRRGSQRGSVTRSGSGGDLREPAPTFVPVDKLAKMMAQLAQKEDGVNGITENVISKHLFPSYPDLSRQFFRYARATSRARDPLPQAAFRIYCERLLAMLDDTLIIETYVKMFTCEVDEEGSVSRDSLHRLLYTSYKLSLDHHPEGPQTCPHVLETLGAAVAGCFQNKDTHSVGFVVRWAVEQCPRLVLPVQRYVVHVLGTRHRAGDAPAGGVASPVLDGPAAALLSRSACWLLAGALPALYSAPPPNPEPRAWLARLMGAPPAHWTPLYESRDHGLGSNRFLHHVTNYRGPTVLLLAGGGALVAAARPDEWRESHQYRGGPDCALLQLRPHMDVLAHGERLFYLNASIRGHGRGLRAGPDPRRPLLTVDEGFDSFAVQGVPYRLDAIEVWGCGDRASRDSQLDIKKWQVKEAERQRNVKISPADWMEHPDRYLLELGGRPQYNNAPS